MRVLSFGMIIFWLLVLALFLGMLTAAVWVWQGWFTFRPGQVNQFHPAPVDPEQPQPAEATDNSEAPVLYRLSRQWVAEVGRPAGVAVDAKDRIDVVGEKKVQVFDLAGRLLGQWELAQPARCIGVAGPAHPRPGAVYLGYAGKVEIRTDKGEIVGGWPLPGDHAEPTSIAFREKEILVADAAAKCVHRFDADGKLLGQLGKQDLDRGYPGLILPSAYCDVAVDGNGLVWVANPGLRRLEAYQPEGRLERFWGQSTSAPEGFFGCCNPAHFCLLPDGRFVTSEKGWLRIKVYSAEGILEGWVARPNDWSAFTDQQHWIEKIQAADVAADSQGRIVVLHLGTGQIHVFEPIQPNP